MISDKRILDDLAKLVGGAASTAAGAREQAEQEARERLHRLFARADLATGEDLATVREMAQQARSEQEALGERVSDLERQVADLRAKLEAGERQGRNRRTSRSTTGGTAQSTGRRSRKSGTSRSQANADDSETDGGGSDETS